MFAHPQHQTVSAVPGGGATMGIAKPDAANAPVTGKGGERAGSPSAQNGGALWMGELTPDNTQISDTTEANGVTAAPVVADGSAADAEDYAPRTLFSQAAATPRAQQPEKFGKEQGAVDQSSPHQALEPATNPAEVDELWAVITEFNFAKNDEEFALRIA
eukprot:gene10768-2333_t